MLIGKLFISILESNSFRVSADGGTVTKRTIRINILLGKYKKMSE